MDRFVNSFFILLSALTSCGKTSSQSKLPNIDSSEDVSFKGNGAPQGSHAFNLNIIGVPKNKTADMAGNSGRRIFMPLEGKSRILLSEGDFQVIDANGTDGSASFSLPNPDPTASGVFEYRVFARALGKPGGSSRLNTCATDPLTLEEVCSVEAVISTRTKGKSSFANVTNELLSISVDLDGDGTLERIPLFDERLQGFLWGYDNNGLKLLQLRFYPNG